jgi:hypothetical protein
VESCPQVEFWREVPSLVKDGVTFTVQKVKACSGKGNDQPSGGFDEI